MKLSDNGTIDRYEMAVFLLKVAEHEDLVVPAVLKEHLKHVRSNYEKRKLPMSP